MNIINRGFNQPNQLTFTNSLSWVAVAFCLHDFSASPLLKLVALLIMNRLHFVVLGDVRVRLSGATRSLLPKLNGQNVYVVALIFKDFFPFRHYKQAIAGTSTIAVLPVGVC